MCQSQPISNQSRVRLALVVLIMIAASPLAKTTSKLCKDKVLLLTGPGGFPDISVGKESACNAGDPSLIPGSGRSTGEGIGYPLQYSGLENSMDCIVYEVTKSRARWSDFTHSLMIAIITIVLLPCHIIIVSFLFSE